jgi:RNA polymerase sigma-70 factor (ECF subfamily)
VRRTLRHFGVQRADIDDVTQEVFVVVHRKLPDFEGRSEIKTWLWGICFRLASDFRDRAHVRKEDLAGPIPQMMATGITPTREIAWQQARQHMNAILRRLDEPKRTVFVLFELKEYTMVEIADKLRIPIQTAYSRLYAARAFVEDALRREQHLHN